MGCGVCARCVVAVDLFETEIRERDECAPPALEGVGGVYLGEGVAEVLCLDRREGGEDAGEDFGGRAEGVDLVDEFLREELEDGGGFLSVDLETSSDDVFLCVVGAFFAEGAALEAFDHGVLIDAVEVDEGEDVGVELEEPALGEVAGDAVEDEELGVGAVLVAGLLGLDVLLPEFDGEGVGDELASGGVLAEDFAQVGEGVERAEHVAGGEVEEAGDGGEDLALCPFADAWGAEEKDGLVAFVFGHVWG